MHDRRFHGNVERLRSPERLAVLEVERVLDWSLEGIAAKSALDVGTGSGVFAEALAARCLAVAGIDANPDMIALAQSHVRAGRFEIAPAEAIPFPDTSFDLVFLGLVLHEADDALRALREALRVCRQRVAVLEWPYEEGEHGPPLAHRLKPEQVGTLVTEAGAVNLETLQLTNVVVYRMAR
jgi:ubiquinone/menaquinone biosynthesis C-methylase UbiE